MEFDDAPSTPSPRGPLRPPPNSPQKHYPNVNSEINKTVYAMVERAILRDVRDTLSGRYTWRKMGDWSEVGARLLAGLGAVLSFAAGTFHDTDVQPWLSFASGSIQTMAMVLGLWVAYSNKESKERAKELNATLRTIGMTGLPDLASLQMLTNAMNVYNRAMPASAV